MFGIPSFSKLILLVVIVLAVWHGFKLIGRLDQARKREDRRNTGRRAGGGRPEVEDTVECPICGAYVVARNSTPCERSDCPY